MGQPFEHADRSFDVAPRYRPGGFDLVIDGERLPSELLDRGNGRYELRIGGRSRSLWLAVDGDRVFLHAEGHHFEITIVDALERLRAAARAARGAAGLTAPMPGVLVEVRAPVGSLVRAGDTVLVIESMKLQTPIAADRDGRVAEVAVEIGQSFDQGAVLARIESESESEEYSA